MSKSIYLNDRQEELLKRATERFSEETRVEPSPGTVVEAALNIYLEQKGKE